jgi:hypothetical protein
MNNPVIKIVNATTGAEVVRPMNSGELEVYEEDKINDQAIEQENIEKAEARTAAEAKLLELGLTVDDLKALLG